MLKLDYSGGINRAMVADGMAPCIASPSAAMLLTFYEQDQVLKFHASEHLRWVKMTVGQVEYLQDLSDGRLRISHFHISCIGFIYFRQVNGTFGQVIFTIHLPDGQVHSIWNFEAWGPCLIWEEGFKLLAPN